MLAFLVEMEHQDQKVSRESKAYQACQARLDHQGQRVNQDQWGNVGHLDLLALLDHLQRHTTVESTCGEAWHLRPAPKCQQNAGWRYGLKIDKSNRRKKLISSYHAWRWTNPESLRVGAFTEAFSCNGDNQYRRNENEKWTDIKATVTVYWPAQHFCVLMYRTAFTSLRTTFNIVAPRRRRRKVTVFDFMRVFWMMNVPIPLLNVLEVMGHVWGCRTNRTLGLTNANDLNLRPASLQTTWELALQCTTTVHIWAHWHIFYQLAVVFALSLATNKADLLQSRFSGDVLIHLRLCLKEKREKRVFLRVSTPPHHCWDFAFMSRFCNCCCWTKEILFFCLKSLPCRILLIWSQKNAWKYTNLFCSGRSSVARARRRLA